MMRDDEHQSDYAVQKAAGTLPPAAKTSREVAHGLRDIGLPLMCLLAAKWGIVSGEIFLFAVSAVLGGNFALRRGEPHHGER